ncbi:MAG: GNAT family N-acetyltransferase [Deltaproteobacteria bacterium]|nr:GNAT family N-acetyltransferase [Deltaproteobacteria bacterium]
MGEARCYNRHLVAHKLTIKIIGGIREVQRTDWDRLLNRGTPFMQWDWLDTLEQTGCVNEETGWHPQHVIVEREGEIVGGCPMYLKLHSMGEFVFDYEWAEVAHDLGIRYYPKMLVGIPFTPVTGIRFITDNQEDRRRLIQLMGQALIKVARDNKISSVHVNFCLGDEREALTQVGFIPRNGLQFHWQNRGYNSFDDYLSAFRSDRRNKIKRERRELLKQGIAIRAIEGDELTAAQLRIMFQLYKGHIDRLYYGRQYLTQEFFDELSRRFASRICLIFASRDSRTIAGTFNIQDHAVLYGRYWGAFEEERYLHFNVCYYSAIEHCIRKGLQRFEAGAGGSFKQLRGLDPQPTTSMHYIVEERFRQAVQRHLHRERDFVNGKQAMLLERSQIKK